MKTSGVPLTSINPKYHAQITAQLHGKPAPVAKYPTGSVGALFGFNGVSDPAKPRLRQSGKGPNKTELAFYAHARACYPGKALHEQAVTLVLANGLRYTPDAFLPGNGATKPAFYEVKGYMRDDAAAKIKMAARVHIWADFFLAKKRRARQGGGWSIEVVLP